MPDEQPKTGAFPDVNRRWLPPPEHMQKVLEAVSEGWAVIEEQGHGQPPLIVFEDGGVIELPKARYLETHRGPQLVAVDAESEGVTRHRDVCGCVDELKGAIRDDPESLRADPQRFSRLLDDALYMIGRMYKREARYREFAAAVAQAAAVLPVGPDPAPAENAAREIRRMIREQTATNVDELNALAEQIRAVASAQEHCLARYKDLAMHIRKLFLDIKGARRWETPGE